MKKFFKITFAVIGQLVLLGGFDYFFVIHSIGVSSAHSWWFFAAYNLVAVSAIVMSVVLRRLDDVKMLPSTVLLIIVLISFLFSTVTVIIDYQNLKFTIISSLSMVIICALAEVIMYIIQRHRCEPEEDEDDSEQDEVEEVVEVKVKKKIKSSAFLLLMTYITDIQEWENLPSMPFVDELTGVVSKCRQYTYEDLRSIEEELKVQTNALKSYTNNNSVERAKLTANRIIDLLKKREEELDRIENE